MGKFTPICEQWVLARPKLRDGKKYFGAYPSGFLHRARYLLGVQGDDPVLHVCAGRVRDYLFRGFGPRDMTVDLEPEVEPDWIMDVREELPRCPHDPAGWKAQLADTPYGPEEARNYLDGKGAEVYPNEAGLLRRMLENCRPGGRVGFLHYLWPAPPTIKVGKSRVAGLRRVVAGREVVLRIHQVACVGVIVGYRNRNRVYGVWELGLPEELSGPTPEIRRVGPGALTLRARV